MNLVFSLTILILTSINLIILIHNIQYVADIDVFYKSQTGRFTFTNKTGQYDSEFCYYPTTCSVLLKDISQRTATVVVYSVIYNFTSTPLTSIDYYTTNTLYVSVILLVVVVVFALLMLYYNKKWQSDRYI